MQISLRLLPFELACVRSAVQSFILHAINLRSAFFAVCALAGERLTAQLGRAAKQKQKSNA